MSLHHHRGAVADENSVNWTLRQETGKRVVVTRHHRKLAPLGFCAEKIHVAHGSPHRGKGQLKAVYSASCDLCRYGPDGALGAGPIALAQEAFHYFSRAALRQIRLGELHMA